MTLTYFRSMTLHNAFIGILCPLSFAPLASGACPNTITPSAPRWSFTTLEWTYTGVLSTSAVSEGAAAWNSRQSFTTIMPAETYNDVRIWDDNNIGPILGQITVYNYGNRGSACYLHRSTNCSQICFNTSRIYVADVQLNPNNIAGAAYDWASYWGISPADAVNRVTKITVSHEFGHFFGLSNWNGAQNCADPTIMSVNDEFYCALTGPTACDGSAVATVYSGWTTVGAACVVCNLSSTCSN